MAEKKPDFLTQIKKLGSKDLALDNKYPQKKNINFIKAEEKQKSKIYMVSTIFIVVILVVLCKFFVLDLIVQTMGAKANYEDMEARVEKLKSLSSDYDDIRDEYNRVGNGCLNSEEISEMSRMEIIDVIDRKIKPYANISAIDINGNSATVVIDGNSLQKVSEITDKLEKDEKVSFVAVSTAGSNTDDGNVTATLMITFEGGGDQ